MKFAEHLLAHITPEWRRQYIVYEDMKTMLYEAVENLPTIESVGSYEVEQMIKRFDRDFFAFCEKELFKINVFYEEKLAEAKRKFDTLRKEMDALIIEHQHQQQQHHHHHSHSHLHPDARLTAAGRQPLTRRLLGPGASLVSVTGTGQSNLLSTHKEQLSVSRRQSVASDKFAHTGEPIEQTSKQMDNGLAPTPAGHLNQSYINRPNANTALTSSPIKYSSYGTIDTLSALKNIDRKKLHDLKKIFKKHDKLMGNEEGKKWHHSHVECAFFHTNKDVDKLIEDTENIVTYQLESGDRQRAMKRLRVPPLNDAPQPWTTFRVGLFLGAFLVLTVAVMLTGVFQQTGDDWRIVFRLYRSSMFIVIFIFLIGVNIYGWRGHGVNHVLIFELDPRNHLGAQDLLEIAFAFGVLWCCSVLLFLWSPAIGIPPLMNPMILNGLMLVYLLNPTRTFHYSARTWLICSIGRVLTSPLHRVRFCDFWLADQLNSLVPLLLDIEYSSCFYLTSTDLYGNAEKFSLDRCVVREPRDLWLRGIVACLPAWWRFSQCVRRYFDEGRRVNPHLLNAGKYATVWLVVLFSTLTEHYQGNYATSTENPFFFCWIASLVFSSCYTYTWDIKMDWGLLDPRAPPEYKFLREELVYPVKWYYVAIVQDFVLRFAWTLNMSLTEVGAISPDLMNLVLAPAEIIRRFIWNFYRLENEHLNNCGEFRAVRDISISGQNIDMSALNRILRIMDEPDGLSAFRSRVKAQLAAAKKRALASDGADQSVVLVI